MDETEDSATKPVLSEPGSAAPKGRERGRPPGPPRPPEGMLVRTATVFYAALFGAAWAWSALAGESLLYANPAAAERGVAAMWDTGLGLVAALLVILISEQLTRMTEAGAVLARSLGSLLGRLSWGRCIWLALCSGLAEEAFFRGALQPRIGLFAASLVFGLAHLVPRRGLWSWSVFAMVVGLMLGVLFDATGNLVAPVVAHVGINAINLRLLSQRYGVASVG